MKNLESRFNSEEFDQELLENEFIMNHPFLLPFIGKKYNRFKIMIVAESHYLTENKSINLINWYEDKIDIDTIHPLDKRNITTRVVVSNWLSGSDETQPIFDKVAKSFCEATDISDSKINRHRFFEHICYFNFFQRPEFLKGKSISLVEKDLLIANLVFNHFLTVLKPKHVIFISKKAYNHLTNKNVVNLSLRHPSSYKKWWTKKINNVSSEDIFKLYCAKNFKLVINEEFDR